MAGLSKLQHFMSGLHGSMAKPAIARLYLFLLPYIQFELSARFTLYSVLQRCQPVLRNEHCNPTAVNDSKMLFVIDFSLVFAFSLVSAVRMTYRHDDDPLPWAELTHLSQLIMHRIASSNWHIMMSY